MDNPTDGNRTDTSNSGLRVPLLAIAFCALLLLGLIVLAVSVS